VPEKQLTADQREIARLKVELARLQQVNDQLRARVKELLTA
jgi:hypothetical protein